MVVAVGWPDVAIALIVAIPAILAAIFAGLARREVKTSNGKTLAREVEQTHAVVTRTLGERKQDRVTPGSGKDFGKRETDD